MPGLLKSLKQFLMLKLEIQMYSIWYNKLEAKISLFSNRSVLHKMHINRFFIIFEIVISTVLRPKNANEDAVIIVSNFFCLICFLSCLFFVFKKVSSMSPTLVVSGITRKTQFSTDFPHFPRVCRKKDLDHFHTLYSIHRSLCHSNFRFHL